MPDNQQILNEFDRIQEQLSQGFAGDPRLSSGVPEEQRGSDTEFIQMSGLVRPVPLMPTGDAGAPDTDLDATKPVSFFEKGVADVDADMTPEVTRNQVSSNKDIDPIETSRAAMSHLRDIIADLTKDAPTVPTDPALMARLERTGVLPPAPPGEETPVAIPIEELLAECAPTHPMQQDTPPAEEAQRLKPLVAEIVDEPLGKTPAPAIAPALIRHAPVLPDHAAHLEEAEKLLDELESDHGLQPIVGMQAMTSLESAADEIPDEALDFKTQSKRRHRTPKKHPALESLARLAVALLFVCMLAAGAYAGYMWLQQRMSAPAQLFNQAARFAAQGEYARASGLYEEFAAMHPADPLRPEAQFAAAFTLQMQQSADSDDRQEIAQESLRLFDQFRSDNPTHPKIARAETLMGRLNYESGNYQQAIELLRNPELRLLDPASAVPALRTLARASAKIGDPEAARSYYLQSAGAQDNHSPDVDYAELGSLYQSLADRNSDLDKRIRLQQLAIESWTHALEVPGIDPSNKQAIRSQLDVLRERLQGEPGMAPAMEALDLSVDAPEAETPGPLEPIAESAVAPTGTPAAPAPELDADAGNNGLEEQPLSIPVVPQP